MTAAQQGILPRGNLLQLATVFEILYILITKKLLRSHTVLSCENLTFLWFLYVSRPRLLILPSTMASQRHSSPAPLDVERADLDITNPPVNHLKEHTSYDGHKKGPVGDDHLPPREGYELNDMNE